MSNTIKYRKPKLIGASWLNRALRHDYDAWKAYAAEARNIRDAENAYAKENKLPDRTTFRDVMLRLHSKLQRQQNKGKKKKYTMRKA